MRVIGRVLATAGALALAAGMTVEANAMTGLGTLTADSQVRFVADAKPEAKKEEPKKAEPKKAEPAKTEVKKAEPKKAEPKKAEPKKAEAAKAAPAPAAKKVVKAGKKAKKTCGVGKYHKKGKCVDAATNPVTPKPAKVKKAKKK